MVGHRIYSKDTEAQNMGIYLDHLLGTSNSRALFHWFQRMMVHSCPLKKRALFKIIDLMQRKKIV